MPCFIKLCATLAFFIVAAMHANNATAICNGIPTTANLMMSNYSYLGTIQNNPNVTVADEVGLRQAVVGAMISEYRLSHGQNSLPTGTAVVAGYSDNSSECLLVGPYTSPTEVAPIDGTQKGPSGDTTGGGAAGGAIGGFGSSSYNSGGTTWHYTCDDYYSTSGGVTEYTGTICELIYVS